MDGRAEYTAKITLDDKPTFHGFAEAPLKAGPGWYRGDLHLHTQHSDGGCPSRTGKRIPSPTFKTLEAAAGRGLDFVAMTDHNTSAHFHDLAELQAYYDDLLIIPGREVTTFYGHANAFGMTAPLDFQLGGPRAPDLNAILSQVERAGGLLSLNHPGQPSGEACMGCGWTAKADFGRIPAIEAINGTNALGPLSGIPFWEKRLSEGHRITAIGGSDNHDATLTGLRSVGVPTTVVRADSLSQDAILAGIRAGHVFVDAQGTKDRLLEVTAQTMDAKAEMGDVLPTPKDALVRLHIRVKGAAGGKLVVRSDEPKFVPPNPIPLEGDDATADVAFGVDGKRHWVRVDVLDPEGALWLLGNPIYLRSR
jgi:predicted metal-dependent phosphoesterase TrpH